MTQADVTMTVRKASQAVGIIDIEGEVTAFAEDVLMSAYTEASDGGTEAVVLNFSKLDYMNSSGIGLLVTLLIRTQRKNQRLLAFGLNEHYRQIFELTRLNDAIAIYASEDEALDAVNSVAR